jgi:ribosomal protein L5
MQVPRLVKIAVNQGLGSAVGDKKIVDNAVEEMTMITGQTRTSHQEPRRTSATSSCVKACPSVPV